MTHFDWIDAHREQLIQDLQGCIQIPSVYAADHSGYPYGKPVHDCLHYMLSLAERLGFQTYNMDEQLGWCEYGQGEEMIGVLGHLDVVPEGDGWDVPPYSGLVKDGRIFGRGAMDDKGPTVAALYALKALKESGVPLKRRVRILFGLNEETGSADMKYYLAHGGEVPVMGFTPDGEYPVINGEKGLVTQQFARPLESAGDLRLLELQGGTAHNIVPALATARLACGKDLAQKILAMSPEKITCTAVDGGVLVSAEGINAHGATPQEGENAIGRLVLFLNQLPFQGETARVLSMFAEKFGMEWDGTSLGIDLHDEVSGDFTMNLGVLHYDGREMVAKLNYRYPVTKRFEQCGDVVKAAMAHAGFQQTSILHKPCIYMEPDSVLVSKLLKVYSDYTGTSAQPKCIGGGTYAKMIPNILAFGPVFPGDEVREHKPNEFMELARLLDNTKILANAMYELAN